MTVRMDQPLSRRAAIEVLACAGLAPWVGNRFGGEVLRGAPSQAMQTKPIPSTGEEIPVIGLGTGSTFSRAAGGAGERDRLRSTLSRFVELGGALIDTAPNYGSSEPVLGQLLEELGTRNEVFLATKVAQVRGREAGRTQARESRRLSGSIPIDLLQVHNLTDWRTQIPLITDLKAEGLARYVGVTVYQDDQYGDLEEILGTYELDFVQFDYSINNRGVERRLLPMAEDRGVAVITNMPFGAGRLFAAVRGREEPEWFAHFRARSWAQFFLRWIISHPSVTATIPATANVEHLEDNVGAGYEALATAEERTEMRERFEDWVDG